MLAGVGPGVGGVAVEEHPLLGCLQVLAAEVAEAEPGRDRAHVGRIAGQAEQSAHALERGLQEGVARQVPDPGGALVESAPVPSRLLTQAAAQARETPAGPVFGRSNSRPPGKR